MDTEIVERFISVAEGIVHNAGTVSGSIPDTYEKVLEEIEYIIELIKSGESMLRNVKIYLSMMKVDNYCQIIYDTIMKSIGARTIDIDKLSGMSTDISELNEITRHMWILIRNTEIEGNLPADGDINTPEYRIMVGLSGDPVRLEEAKDAVLIDPDSMNWPCENKKHNPMQYLILKHRFVPDDISKPLPELSKNIFGVELKPDSSLKDMCDKLKCGYMLIRMAKPDNYEYTFFNLTSMDYIRENDLFDGMMNGVNKTNINRLNTLRHVSGSEQPGYGIEFYEQPQMVVFDTHDDKTYRVLKRGGEIICDMEAIRPLMNPATSTSRRLESYNRELDVEIRKYLSDPINIRTDLHSDWGEIDSRMTNIVIDMLRNSMKGKKVRVRDFIDVLYLPEFSSEIKKLMTKYISSNDMDIREIRLTVEYEVQKSVVALRERLSALFNSRKRMIESAERENLFSLIEHHIYLNITMVFNKQNNIYNMVKQKYALLKGLGSLR